MTQPGADRVVWSPTGPELAAVTRATVLVILRRDLTALAGVFVVLGLVALPLVGIASAALMAGVPLLVLAPFFFVVTHHRNARVLRAAFPPGVEASAEASDEGLQMVSAVATVQFPWSRLARPRVGSSIVAFRDTLTRRPTVVPRALFPDAWLAYLDAPPAAR